MTNRFDFMKNEAITAIIDALNDESKHINNIEELWNDVFVNGECYTTDSDDAEVIIWELGGENVVADMVKGFEGNTDTNPIELVNKLFRFIGDEVIGEMWRSFDNLTGCFSDSEKARMIDILDSLTSNVPFDCSVSDRETKIRYFGSLPMDDEIREQVHAELAPCTKNAFLDRYEELHLKKYGTEFEI